MIQVNLIGETAGKIYLHLEKNGKKPVGDLRKDLKLEDELFHQAIGWLARENKLSFETTSGKPKKVLVALKV